MKNEFDKKLTDKGWRSMRRALDRDMPEQQRRRRPFVWWWLGALLLLPLAGGSGWWLYHRQAKPAIEVPKPEAAPPTTHKPVAETSTNKNPSGATASARAEANSRQHSEHFPPKALGSKTATTGQMADPAFALVPVYPPLAEQQDTANFENPLYQPLAADFSKIELFAALPIPSKFVEKETTSAPSLFTVTPLAVTVTKKQSSPTRWAFGLSAGLASEKLSALNGFSAGAAVDWKFARKWGLRSGLQYTQSRLSENKRPVVRLDDDTYVLATGNIEVQLDFTGTSGPGTPTSTQAPTVFVPIEKLRQMEMPLLAYWQPVNPLRIFGGASVGYNLSAQASPESFANNTSYFADTQEAKNNLNELAANNLSRWQMSLQTGIGIRFGQHFELGAFYKHGIKGGNKNADTSAEMLADLQGLQLRGAGSSHYFLLSGTWFF